MNKKNKKQPKKHLASITILVEDRQAHALDLNKLLTDNGHLIMARLGINVQRTCIDHCTGFIILAVEAEKKNILKLTKIIDNLYGIKAKYCIITE
jgi:hypothetical protein